MHDIYLVFATWNDQAKERLANKLPSLDLNLRRIWRTGDEMLKIINQDDEKLKDHISFVLTTSPSV